MRLCIDFIFLFYLGRLLSGGPVNLASRIRLMCKRQYFLLFWVFILSEPPFIHLWSVLLSELVRIGSWSRQTLGFKISNLRYHTVNAPCVVLGGIRYRSTSSSSWWSCDKDEDVIVSLLEEGCRPIITVAVWSTISSSSSCEEILGFFLPGIRVSDMNGRTRTLRSLEPSTSRNLGKRNVPVTLTPTLISAKAQRPTQAEI